MLSFLQYLKQIKNLNDGLCGSNLYEHFKIFKEWKAQLQSGKFPLEMELPWISIVAKNYIENYFSRKNKNETRVFEYGSGGSTLFFLQYASEVYSVEHDEEWYQKVYDVIGQRQIESWVGYFKAPNLLDANLPQKPDASNPHDYYTRASAYLNYHFKDYASSIDSFSDNYFDVVLVDGRSRPSCLQHSLPKVKPGGLLVLDNAERDYYRHAEIIPASHFKLVSSCNSALICTNQFTQTNIYIRINQ